MSRAADMFDTHPGHQEGADRALILEVIEACTENAQACTACADACLSEESVDSLVACIRSDLDCADVCAATAAVLTRQTATDEAIIRAVVSACRTVSERCGDECARHADMHEHCRVCSEACRRTQAACDALLAAF